MSEEIVNYVKDKYNILIGERTAEDVKIAIGSAIPLEEEKEVILQGRDLVNGLPKSIKVSSVEIREAIMGPLGIITEAVKEAIEDTPPELVRDLLGSGLYLVGGGSLIKGLDKYWQEALNISVHIVDDPISTVARGTAQMLDHIELLDKVQTSWKELV